MQKYNLHFSHNLMGITVLNKAKTVKGDYQKVAHISELGKISYHKKNLPDKIKKEIKDYSKSLQFEYKGFIIRKVQTSIAHGDFYMIDAKSGQIVETYPLENHNKKSPEKFLTDYHIKIIVDWHCLVERLGSDNLDAKLAYLMKILKSKENSKGVEHRNDSNSN